MRSFYFFVSILSITTSWSQKMAVEFDCSIFDIAQGAPAANADIFILENSDTVYTGKSDENGKFKVNLTLDKTKRWKVIGSLYSRKSEITLYDPKDSSTYNFDHLIFAFDLTLLKYCTLQDPSIYYQINQIDRPENIEISALTAQFTEYSTVKFEYSQTVSKKEKPGVAKKRMAAFKLLLERNGVPISNVTFSDQVYYLDESESDQRAKIQCVVKSWGN